VLRPEIEQVLADGGGILADLDGCLIAGDTVLDGSVELARRAGGRLVVISNNSTHSPAGMRRRLLAMGLDIAADRLVLAGMAAVEATARRFAGARVLVVGSRAVEKACRAAGLVPVGRAGEAPEAVLVCRAPDAGMRLIQEAVVAAARGVPVVVANPDITHPGPGLVPVIETGTLAEILRLCAGAEMTVIGKPEPGLFEAGLARLGLPVPRVLMIGDNPRTDGEGAERVGLKVLLMPAGEGPQAREAPDSTYGLPQTRNRVQAARKRS
jgi:HAD superfamily hydrolase (TIGR01450 family)